MATRVRFIGGELDGQLLNVQVLGSRYEYKADRRVAAKGTDAQASQARRPQATQYTLVRNSSGTPFYVEDELLKLAKAQGINPLPLE